MNHEHREGYDGRAGHRGDDELGAIDVQGQGSLLSHERKEMTGISGLGDDEKACRGREPSQRGRR
jgi:hypothetical protein